MIVTMFRTRDFILVFTTVVFLIAAIGTTVWQKRSSSNLVTEASQFAEVGDKEYTAEVYAPETISREERLADMRKKIAEGSGVTISSPETIVMAVEEVEENDIPENETKGELDKCLDYIEYSGLWPAVGVQLDVAEGARIVYMEITSENELNQDVSSSSIVTLPEVQRDVLLQLPVRSGPMPGTSCIASDVVGIAKDGSLIRNREVGLYGIFGSGTIVGYALDGFPIYGAGEVVSDECGGSIIGGQYGYYLSKDRETILNCFAAVPVDI